MTNLYFKLSVRVLPILFIAYLINYLDRVNISFARLTMCSSLGIGDAAYGLGAGLFFWGYFFLQVPSNLMLQRVGARRWLALIILVWGGISAITALIRNEWQFYAVRLLLGAAESGFFPGVILFLNEWYPSSIRSRILGCFLTAIPVAGLLGGPLSGWIMTFFQGAGLEGWQWLFLIEGIPCLVMAALIFFGLPDEPSTVAWLSKDERSALSDVLLAETNERVRQGAPEHAMAAFRLPIVWKLCLLYFSTMMGLYGLSFWLPVKLEELGWKTPWQIGLASAVPWAVAVVFMIFWGTFADRTRAWRIFAGFAGLLGGVGFAACGRILHSEAFGLLALSLAACGVMGMMATQWAIPGNLLNGAAAATGVALINSFGNLGGFTSPILIGYIIQRTGDQSFGLYLTATFLIAAGVAFLCLRSLNTPVFNSSLKPKDSSLQKELMAKESRSK